MSTDSATEAPSRRDWLALAVLSLGLGLIVRISSQNRSHVSGDVFDTYPDEQRWPLLEIRALIFSVAGATDGVGPLVETLKWGQPRYLTEAPR